MRSCRGRRLAPPLQQHPPLEQPPRQQLNRPALARPTANPAKALQSPVLTTEAVRDAPTSTSTSVPAPRLMTAIPTTASAPTTSAASRACASHGRATAQGRHRAPSRGPACTPTSTSVHAKASASTATFNPGRSAPTRRALTPAAARHVPASGLAARVKRTAGACTPGFRL